MAKSKKRKQSSAGTKPKLLYSLFCLLHSADSEGRQNYLGIFDELNVTTKGSKKKKSKKSKLKELPQPENSKPFVVAFRVNALGAKVSRLQIFDPDKKEILRTEEEQLSSPKNGQHKIHYQLGNGLPIQAFGDYTLALYIDNKKVGVAILPVHYEKAK